MNKLKLTAFFFISIIVSAVLFSACKTDNVFKRDLFVSKYFIPMNGSQNVPANSSTATGTIDVVYARDTRLLTYTINWSGLSGPPFNVNTTTAPAIGIYGTADAGFMAVPVAPFATYLNGIVQAITTGFASAASGSYTGQLFVDGVNVKEADLLNNKFYVMIRTSAFPAGQIRGQIDFR